MIYTLTETVAANTPVIGALQFKMPVTGGLIYKVEIYLPPGSCGLMGLIICDGGYQIWPSERKEWFFGDDSLIAFDDRYYVNSPNKILDVFAYNLDDTYAHIFQVRIGMANDPAVISSYIPSLANMDMASMIADILASQDQSYEAQRARAVAAADAAEGIV
jgi:hypothetical protein